MTKIFDHDNGGFNETQKRNSDKVINEDVNYDESNMAIAPALDFLYAMKPKIIDEDRKEDVRETIRALEEFNPDVGEEIAEEAYKPGRIRPGKAVQLLENEKAQLDEVNRLTNGRKQEEYNAIQEAYETVEEVYTERFEPMSDTTLAITPYSKIRQEEVGKKT